jgi:hypothetical protein
VQAYQFIFTSPSSAEKDDENDINQVPAAKRARKTLAPTRAGVATIIGLRSVTPRPIAYAAVQVFHVRALICAFS